jgi:hypothetical protein
VLTMREKDLMMARGDGGLRLGRRMMTPAPVAIQNKAILPIEHCVD